MSRTGLSALGSLLAGLGIFGIVLALLFEFFLPGQVVKFPLNEYEVMTLQGTGVTYFSSAKLSEVTGATMQSTLTVSGDVAAAGATKNSGIAVWKEFAATEDITNHVAYADSTQSLAFDRKTGQLINCCGNAVNANTNVHVGGQGYVWPFNAAKQSYQVFDNIALKPETARYEGAATVAGTTTYRYVESVTNQQIGTQTVPGSVVGMGSSTVTLPEMYTATNTFWVDPVTGNVIKLGQNQKVTLADSSGATKLVVFQGDMVTTPASTAAVAASDRSNFNKTHLIEDTVPLIIGIIGVVLFIAGIVVSFVRRTEGEEEYEDVPVSSHA